MKKKCEKLLSFCIFQEYSNISNHLQIQEFLLSSMMLQSENQLYNIHSIPQVSMYIKTIDIDVKNVIDSNGNQKKIFQITFWSK